MNQKGFVNIIVIIGVIILVGVAGYFIVNQQTPTPRPIPSPTPTPTPTPTTAPSPTPIPISQPIEKRRSSTNDWATNEYTKILFEFLKLRLSEDYLYSHFELVRPQETAKNATVWFRLHYGSEFAFTANSSRGVGDPLFISGSARIKDGSVEQYTGPLKEYEVKVSKDEATTILVRNGVSKVLVPGARPINNLELWIYDSYHKTRGEKIDNFFWIGGIRDETSADWYWVNAIDGSLKREQRLGDI